MNAAKRGVCGECGELVNFDEHDRDACGRNVDPATACVYCERERGPGAACYCEPLACGQCGNVDCTCGYMDDGPQDTRGIW